MPTIVGPRDLGYVYVSLGIHGDSVRGIKSSRLFSITFASHSGQYVPLGVHYCHTWTKICADIVGGDSAEILTDVHKFFTGPVVYADRCYP